MQLTLSHSITPRIAPTERACRLACMFGLSLDDTPTQTLIPPITLQLRPAQLVFITGPSGTGKSTLLRLIGEQLHSNPHARTIEFDHHPADTDEPLVDQLGDTLEQAVRCLSLAGLSDAHLMLRSPAHLSEGQRYRWKLARAMAACERRNDSEPPRVAAGRRGAAFEPAGEQEMAASRPPAAPRGGSESPRLPVLLADEFGSTLDRLTAAIVARNIRKWVAASSVCFIAACAHDDLIEHLAPDTLILQDETGTRVLSGSPPLEGRGQGRVESSSESSCSTLP